MFVDHIHQPWRTLAAIINKCFSGKSASNDRLRKSRIDILWGMFYRENIDYSELIWEDFAFQINNRQRKKCRYDSIILKPDVTLELGKSISLTEAVEDEVARQVHATHEKIMSFDPSQKLKGIQTLTHEEKLAADTMQALKASRKSIRSQLHARGSSKGTGTKLGVLDELTVTPTTSSEGTGTKLGVPDKENVTSEAKANVTLDWGSEEESEYTEEDDDENIE
ncbi:hypothetical protein Tco_0778669 [Tanacetum coccineum]